MDFKFRIRSKIKETWPLYQENFSLLVLFTIAMGVIQVVLGGKDKSFFVILVLYILNFIISYIWVRSVMDLLDGKKFNPFSQKSLPNFLQFWKYIGTLILVMLFSLIGFILLFVPGLYITGRLFPAIYLSVEKGGKPWSNIRESWEMTKGNGWRLFWKSFVIQLFIFVGFLALLLGIFVTYPIGMIVSVMLYRDFKKFKENLPKDAIITPEIVEKKEVKTENPGIA